MGVTLMRGADAMSNGRTGRPEIMQYVESAARLSDDIQTHTLNLIHLFETERHAHQVWQSALKAYEEKVAVALSDADYEASVAKTGPLAGIARTSDAYKMAVTKLRGELARLALREEYHMLVQKEGAYLAASIALESAKIRLSSMKTVSDLTSALLRAVSS
jgi:hypothetical protein